jgi:hypothetical protein
MEDPDPHRALQRIVSILCDFWSVNTPALVRLHSPGAGDSELEESLRQRNERRRDLLLAVVRRMAGSRRQRARSIRDLIDVLFALTSLSFFAQLVSGGRTTDAACRLIQTLSADAIRRAGIGPN